MGIREDKERERERGVRFLEEETRQREMLEQREAYVSAYDLVGHYHPYHLLCVQQKVHPGAEIT